MEKEEKMAVAQLHDGVQDSHFSRDDLMKEESPLAVIEAVEVL